MNVTAYEVVLEVDGMRSSIKVDNTYPAVCDWQSATLFAMMLARHSYPEAVSIDLLTVSEFESDEYKEYAYIHDGPLAVH
jgi:hypothetical protein